MPAVLPADPAPDGPAPDGPAPADPAPAPADAAAPDAERRRLAEDRSGAAPWKRFGPWLAERAWGTVREDYSAGGDAWSWLPYAEARRTAYRWNEDGMAGICDADQRLCLAFAFWNGRDDHLKERAFGLTNSEGNHGEDCKEQWWYVDATPTASLLRWRLHYPQQAFPYDDLRRVNAQRGKLEPEYELADTGILEQGFWQLEITYAKGGPDDIVVRVEATNRGPATETLHVLPTLWFRNTWSWDHGRAVPVLRADQAGLAAVHPTLGPYHLSSDSPNTPLVCDNVTDTRGRYGVSDGPQWPKNGIGDHVVHGADTVNPAGTGTKGALHHTVTVEPGATATITLRLQSAPVAAVTPAAVPATSVPGTAVPAATPPAAFSAAKGPAAEEILAARQREADAFHASVLPPEVSPTSAEAATARQAFAGLIWGQCFYNYDVPTWLAGDPAQPPPPPERLAGRNNRWWHLLNHDVLSMPDPWEYPWYAAWDLAFHTVSIAHIDPDFAKNQLLLLCREWYMAPNGQLPAYEWDFGDVNPPVHAWAALEVFHISGGTDLDFLERIFHKLLINHTWWTNREDREGNNIFEGGFLGLDNIGAFDRSHVPPGAGRLEQADATAWMAMYTLDLLQIALRLARHDPTYEDIATKFFEHFTHIAVAMEQLWDETDGFFYDVLHADDGATTVLRVRSIAGLVALTAQRMVPAETFAALPDFTARFDWYVKHHPFFGGCTSERADGNRLLSAVPTDRLHRLLVAALDEGEFLSPYGLRSLSRRHATAPYSVEVGGVWTPPVDYEPGESTSGLFGGNSNWRGPVWFPLNALVITSLRRAFMFYGDTIQAELPTGSGHTVSLQEAAQDLTKRLVSLFTPGSGGQPPAAPATGWPADLLWFHEYFHGDSGKGLGASHQTGWTALVADLVIRNP